MNKIKQSLLILILLELIFSYAPAYAQTGSNNVNYNYGTSAGVASTVTEFLCTPSNTTNANVNPNSQDLFKCVNQLYKFAIVLASVVGVFFIVIAGYIYMSAGDSEGVTKAKDILTSTITALVILMAGYVLLQALDPDLVQFQPIQPPAVTGVVVTGVALSTAVTGVPGAGAVNTAVCAINKGSCSVSQMSQCTAWDPNAASAICGVESGGVPSVSSGVDHCTDGTSFSVGLMQINIISSGGAPYMPSACPANIFVSSDGNKVQTNHAPTNAQGVNVWNCKLADPSGVQYNACVAAISDPATNLTAACALYNQANGWGPWSTTYNKCSAN